MTKRAITAASQSRRPRPGRGRVNLAFLRSQSEAEIERAVPDEYANLPDDFWDQAVVVYPEAKQAISLRVDRDVLDWFKRTGPRYQSRMNAVLRHYMAQSIRAPRYATDAEAKASAKRMLIKHRKALEIHPLRSTR